MKLNQLTFILRTGLTFSLVIFMSGINILMAQKEIVDNVFLKNGDIIFGRITQTDTEKGVRISNDCGSYLFQFQEIDSMKFNARDHLSLSKTKGFYNVTSIGLLFGEGENGFLPFPSLTTVNGYQFNKHWFAGLGIGFEHFEWSVLPLFVQAAYDFKNERFTPYIALKTGYTFPLEKNTNNNYNNPEDTFGGIAVNPEVGIKIAIGEKNAFTCSLGYHYQKLSYEENYYDYMYESNYNRLVYTHYNRISFRIGFVFR